MEMLLSINWDGAVDESNSFFTKEVLTTSLAAYHQLHAIPLSPWPVKQGKPEELVGLKDTSERKWNAKNLKRIQLPGVNGKGKVLQVEPPKLLVKKSVLTPQQQKDYLYAIIRVKKALLTGAPVDGQDVKRLKDLQVILADEMQEYQTLAKNTMMQNPECYSLINSGIAQYVSQAWEARLSKVQQYPPHYKLAGNTTLIPKENIKTLDLVLENNILEMGKIPSQIFPPLNSLVKIPRTPKLIQRRYPTSVTNDNHVVSKDSNAFKLASKYDVDLVISASTLQVLAGTVGPLFKRTWDIPFSVRDHNVNGKNKRIIYFDEALPSMEMTAIEKNNFFNSLAVKFQFTNVNPSRYCAYGKPKKPSATNASCSPSSDLHDEDVTDVKSVEMNSEDDVDKAEAETLSVFRPPSLVSKAEERNSEESSAVPVNTIENLPNDSSAATDSDSSEASLFIDIGDGSFPPSNKKRRQKSSPLHGVGTKKNAVPASTNLLNTILQDQEKMMQSHRKQPSSSATPVKKSIEPENPLDYDPPKRNGNVSYRTWNLRANDRTIRLLIRTSVDTAIVTPKNEFKTFLMVSKTEYQPWYGAECSTPREIAEQWMDLHLRPGCQQLRVRLDAYTGDFIAFEQTDAAGLLAEAGFQFGDRFLPSNCLSQVWAVLSSLRDMDLAIGSYLLRHGVTDGMCVQVLSACEQQDSQFDLHLTYAAVDPKATTTPEAGESWVALDPMMVLPFQRVLERPPLTFEPRDAEVNTREIIKRKREKKLQASLQPPKKANKKKTANDVTK